MKDIIISYAPLYLCPICEEVSDTLYDVNKCLKKCIDDLEIVVKDYYLCECEEAYETIEEVIECYEDHEIELKLEIIEKSQINDKIRN